MKILILGGYGTFGGRLAHLLADDSRITLVLAGRSEQKAKAFCESLRPGAPRMPACFDRNADVERQLSEIRPDLVVDASGPFQSYGDDPYRVVKACIAIGANYMDLADGADFVRGIAEFDAQAKERNIYMLSGVSSFPVLTAAVVRRLSAGFTRIDSVTAGIAPSPYAGVGLNVIRAITGYAGKPVALVRGGRPAHGNALIDNMRYTIAAPGCLPLDNLRFSLVDVPDLQLIPDSLPGLDSIWIGVAPVPEILHRMLSGLAWLVRLRLLSSLLPFARLIHFVTTFVRRGEHRGGMFVSLTGSDSKGDAQTRSWHLLAEGDDGPFIPSMAIEAIVRRNLNGLVSAPGARPAMQELELADYEAIFRQRRLYAGVWESRNGAAPASLYQRLLGEAWATLPKPLKAMHAFSGERKSSGLATVERGGGMPARLIARLFGFPAQGAEIPVHVLFHATERGELWRRTFGVKSFSSFQSEGRGRYDRLIAERFGPFTFGLALVLTDGTLKFIVRRWNFLGIPLPRRFAPQGDSYESVIDGRFHFHVEIKYPLIGLIVRYRGWLVPSDAKETLRPGLSDVCAA